MTGSPLENRIRKEQLRLEKKGKNRTMTRQESGGKKKKARVKPYLLCF